MSRVLNCKKTIVIGVVVFLLYLKSFAAGDWDLITQLPTERNNFTTAVVDNKVYLIGGTLEKDVGGPYGITTVEVYNPQTDAWQRVADMPTPRTSAKAAVVNGIIYVFGGYSSKDRLILNWKLPIVVEAYDPKTDTWTQKQDMPVSRINFRLGVVGGKVYLFGGTTGFGDGHEERMDRVDIYDPATDTWMKGPKMPTRRDPMAVAVASDRLYVIGGRGWPKAGNGGPLLTVIEEYNPRKGQWQKKNDMLDVNQAFSTVVVKDHIYLIGGFAHAQFIATVDVYNPQKDAWRDISKLPAHMMPYGAAAVNGKIYVFAGYNREEGFIPDVVVFDTGFRAVTAVGRLSTRWGELKVKHQRKP